MLLSLSFALEEGTRQPQGCWNPKFAWSCQRSSGWKRDQLATKLSTPVSELRVWGREDHVIHRTLSAGRWGHLCSPAYARFLQPLGAHGAGMGIQIHRHDDQIGEDSAHLCADTSRREGLRSPVRILPCSCPLPCEGGLIFLKPTSPMGQRESLGRFPLDGKDFRVKDVSLHPAVQHKMLTPGTAGTWHWLEQTPSCSELILVTAGTLGPLCGGRISPAWS